MRTNARPFQSNSMVLAVFGVIALTFGVIGTAILAGTIRDRARMTPTTGTIIDLLEERDSQHGRLFRPVVRFRTTTGRTVEVRGGTSSNPPLYDLEQRVPVRYNPDNPTEAALDTPFENWFFPGMFCMFGVLFGAIGAGMALWRLRGRGRL